jgi:protein-S-isoprenylcysteine O-methyltransferase Ste14
VTNNSPEEKPLRTTSFVVHATRGVIRDQGLRRKTMFVLILIALVLLFAGRTFLQSSLNPREHLLWFGFYWLICLWMTLTAMLLALFDLLTVRREARKERRMLNKKFGASGQDREADK